MQTPHYLNGRMSKGFFALLLGRFLQFIADNVTGLFLPIFLFIKLGHSINNVMIFFSASWLLYALLLPLGARMLNKFGLRRALRISVFTDALVFVCFYFWDYAPIPLIILAIIFRVLNLLLFWIPFHIDFAKLTDKKDRGKEYSLIQISSTVISIIMPLLAGFLISQSGFNAIFFITIILTLIPYFPLMFIPRTHEDFTWGYRETFKKYFAKENRQLVLAHMSSGAENLVSYLIWPIFIWMLLDGKYLEVGVISTLISGTTVMLQLLAGSWTDKFDKRMLLKWGSVFYAIGWVVKMFISTAFQIFVVGVYHGFTNILMRTPFDSLTYELAADQGHFIDEFTVIKEMAVQFGRVLMTGVVVVTLLFVGLKWTFFMAAAVTVGFNFLPDEELLGVYERIKLKLRAAKAEA